MNEILHLMGRTSNSAGAILPVFFTNHEQPSFANHHSALFAIKYHLTILNHHQLSLTKHTKNHHESST